MLDGNPAGILGSGVGSGGRSCSGFPSGPLLWPSSPRASSLLPIVEIDRPMPAAVVSSSSIFSDLLLQKSEALPYHCCSEIHSSTVWSRFSDLGWVEHPLRCRNSRHPDLWEACHSASVLSLTPYLYVELISTLP